MDNFKFLKTVIIVLLLINIGTLGYMWFGNSHQFPPPPHHEHGNAMDFLTKELGLNTDQQNKLNILRKEHHDIMEQINTYDRKMHDHYFELLAEPVLDSLKIGQIADEMAANRKKIELQTFYHFKQVRAICNPEQQKKFDSLIGDALREMGRNPPNR